MTGEDALPLRCEGLTKRFGSTEALVDLDLELRPGEALGYLGPNGAGKTTTIRLVVGLLRPTAGRAAVFGRDCTAEAVEAHRLMAFVPGEASLWPGLTGAQTLHLLGQVHGGVDAAYRDELVERFALDPGRKVRTYSKGNRQKVLLIAGLMSRAPLLVLDEPTSGLDPLMEEEFRTCVREARARGQSVLLSSHSLSEVEAVCDRVAILRAGHLIDTGSLTDMRHLAALTVDITFAGKVPDLRAVDGVVAVARDGEEVRCHLQGPIGPLLAAIQGYDVRRMLSREPSLEELFFSLYDSPVDHAGA